MKWRPCGIVPPMVTPLDDEEQVDELALRRLVNHLIGGGVHGLFVLGSQGEAFALCLEEKARVMEIVVDETRHRVPVLAGTGMITTRETIALTKRAESIGVDGVSVVTPYFVSPSIDELYHHYVSVAGSTRLPVLLYTIPGRTGVHLSPELVVRLSRIENIVGIKDSGGDFGVTIEFIRRTHPGFSVLAGRDMLIYATLLCGGSGAITATSSVVPGLAVEIYNACQAGEYGRALAAQMRLAPLRSAFDMGTFPVVMKEALALMGICSEKSKAPVGPIPEPRREELRKILVELNALS